MLSFLSVNTADKKVNSASALEWTVTYVLLFIYFPPIYCLWYWCLMLKFNPLCCQHFVIMKHYFVFDLIFLSGHNTLPMFGLLKAWDRVDVCRLINKLVMDNYLAEYIVRQRESTNSYLTIGTRANSLMSGRDRVNLSTY